MATPRRYTKGTSFSGYQATNPNRPLPGPSLDNELANIETSVNEAISALGDIRRDDGFLRNGIVTRDALSPDLATGVTPATLWEAGLVYQAQDTVSVGAAFYRCTIGHTSNVDFLVDLNAGRWVLYADIGTLATGVGVARDEAVAAAAAAVPAAATASAAAVTASAAAVSATTNYDLFDDRYLGEKTSLPTLDNDGNALVDGALVSLTGQTPSTLNGMYVRRSGVWQPVVGAFQGVQLGFRYVATGGQTVFSGVDANGLTLAYTLGAIIVTVNGVTQTPNTYTASNGTSVVFGAGLSASDVVVIYSFGSFVVADAWTKIEADGRFAAIAHVGAGGTAHALATTSVAGFLSAADKTKLDNTASLVRLAPVATTAGTAFDFTGLPADVVRIEIILDRCSLTGADNFLIQLGTSGGIEVTGYDSFWMFSTTATAFTAGFTMVGTVAAPLHDGILTLRRTTGNTWIAEGFSAAQANYSVFTVGRKTAAGTVDRLRLTRSGTDTFDAGAVIVQYWRGP